MPFFKSSSIRLCVTSLKVVRTDAAIRQTSRTINARSRTQSRYISGPDLVGRLGLSVRRRREIQERDRQERPQRRHLPDPVLRHRARSARRHADLRQRRSGTCILQRPAFRQTPRDRGSRSFDFAEQRVVRCPKVGRPNRGPARRGTTTFLRNIGCSRSDKGNDPPARLTVPGLWQPDCGRLVDSCCVRRTSFERQGRFRATDWRLCLLHTLSLTIGYEIGEGHHWNHRHPAMVGR